MGVPTTLGVFAGCSIFLHTAPWRFACFVAFAGLRGPSTRRSRKRWLACRASSTASVHRQASQLTAVAMHHAPCTIMYDTTRCYSLCAAQDRSAAPPLALLCEMMTRTYSLPVFLPVSRSFCRLSPIVPVATSSVCDRCSMTSVVFSTVGDGIGHVDT